MKCSEKSYLDAPLISSISENTESYGNNSYIVVTWLVCKSIEAVFCQEETYYSYKTNP